MFQPRTLSVSPITFFLNFLVVVLTFRIYCIKNRPAQYEVLSSYLSGLVVLAGLFL